MYAPEIESASREEMRKIQYKNLIRTCERVYNNVPMYKKRFDEAGIKISDIKSIDDLSKLPFTYKQDLRDNYPYGLFAAPLDEIVRIHASSGTTGKQTVVGYTANDLDMWAGCVARALAAAGCTKKDFVHISYGYGLFTGGLGIHDGAHKLGAITIPVSSGNTARQMQIMKDFGSTLLCCTPSYALHLSDVLAQTGTSLSDINLKAGVFGAEPWTDGMRKEIEKRLGIKAYDIYGLSEISGPGVSFDCAMQNGLHVNEDNFIPEIIDPDTGRVLPYGEQGELVFTCVTKEALPLIRYRTRDISRLIIDKCECGRTLVRMEKPCGRTDDMLIIRGVNVFPSQIESVLLQFNEVTPHYMIYVNRINNLDTLEVKVEIAPDLMDKLDAVKELELLSKQVKNRIDSLLGISVKVTLVEPNSIQRSEGKAKRVIDNRTQVSF